MIPCLSMLEMLEMPWLLLWTSNITEECYLVQVLQCKFRKFVAFQSTLSTDWRAVLKTRRKWFSPNFEVMGKFQCVPRSQIVISDSTRNNTCVRGMQETLLTLTDHPSGASAWPHLALCSVYCVPSWHVTHSGVVTIISWHQTRHVWHTATWIGGKLRKLGLSKTESFQLMNSSVLRTESNGTVIERVVLIEPFVIEVILVLELQFSSGLESLLAAQCHLYAVWRGWAQCSQDWYILGHKIVYFYIFAPLGAHTCAHNGGGTQRRGGVLTEPSVSPGDHPPSHCSNTAGGGHCRMQRGMGESWPGPRPPLWHTGHSPARLASIPTTTLVIYRAHESGLDTALLCKWIALKHWSGCLSQTVLLNLHPFLAASACDWLGMV